MVIRKKKLNYPIGSFARDMWTFLEGNRASYIWYTFLRGVSEVSPFLLAYFLGRMIDFFTNYSRGDDLTTFYVLVGLIGITGVSEVLLRMYAKMKNSIVGAKTRKRVREIAMSHLMDLELNWHEKEGTGSKLQKISMGSASVYRFFSDFTNNWIISVVVGIIGAIAVFAFVEVKYVIFAIIYLLIFLGVERHYAKKLSYWNQRMSKIHEKVSGKFHESTSNVLSVKSLGLRKIFENSTRKYEKQYYKIWLQTKSTSQTKNKVTKSIASIGYALFLLLVGFDFVSGAITLGSILIFGSYFNRLRSALDRVSGTVDSYIDIKIRVGRLMTILGAEAIDRESDDLMEVPKNWKTIEFKDISFKYKDKLVLDNFNLKIRRGEKLGIVGRSGCGKSTITKLLLGLYQPNKGGIYIDGKNVKEFKHSSITKNVTAVLQDSEMFDMSLADNISIATLKKDEVLLTKAIEFSQLGPVIEKLPRKLSTILGEKGYRVSGGERQRIGIARAIYKNSPLIILDEATSHLDSKTEESIQNAIEENLASKTLLIIAHRLSTLQSIDRIIFMEKGKIVEEGTFKELVKARGKFYDLCRIQKRK